MRKAFLAAAAALLNLSAIGMANKTFGRLDHATRTYDAPSGSSTLRVTRGSLAVRSPGKRGSDARTRRAAAKRRNVLRNRRACRRG